MTTSYRISVWQFKTAIAGRGTNTTVREFLFFVPGPKEQQFKNYSDAPMTANGGLFAYAYPYRVPRVAICYAAFSVSDCHLRVLSQVASCMLDSPTGYPGTGAGQGPGPSLLSVMLWLFVRYLKITFKINLSKSRELPPCP